MSFSRHDAPLLLHVSLYPQYRHLPSAIFVPFSLWFSCMRDYGRAGMQDLTWLVALAVVLGEQESIV